MNRLVTGLDLNDDYTQICCYDKEKSWIIPTMIYRRKGGETWLSGEDACVATLLGGGVIVDKLLKLTARGGISTIGGVCYSGSMLSELFIQKMLEYPEKEFGEDEVAQLVITLQNVGTGLLDTLMYCADLLGISRERVHVTSRTESFIYYVLSQKKELWTNQVGLFRLPSERLCYYEMKVARGMRRNMVRAEAQSQEETFNLDIPDSPLGSKLADKILYSCDEKLLGRRLFSTVLLTGKGFERQDWASDFTRLACSRRKAFVESYLFTRGTAYKGADYTHEDTSYLYIFVCEGRLRAGMALKVLRRGRESNLVVAFYRSNWYKSKSSLDLIVDGQNETKFTITPLGSRKEKLMRVPLSGFPEQPPRTARVELKVGFTDEETMAMVIEDKGFGELFPATKAVVKQEVSL